jgi:5'-nucleotidase
LEAETEKTNQKILVSNDDGILSEGLIALAGALEAVGEVWVVAPDREQSASSHSLTMGRLLRRYRRKEMGPRYFAINGTPTDCVLLGVKKILPEPPRLIVSGINKGENLGDDITYSGTVSAAIEGTILGIPSFAISLVARCDFAFEGAAGFAARLAENILKNPLPRNTFLNVNVPCRQKRGRPYRITRMGKRVYGDSVQEKSDRWGRKYYRIGGNTPGHLDTEDSDFKAVAKGYISITPLHLDWTNYASLEALSKRKI